MKLTDSTFSLYLLVFVFVPNSMYAFHTISTSKDIDPPLTARGVEHNGRESIHNFKSYDTDIKTSSAPSGGDELSHTYKTSDLEDQEQRPVIDKDRNSVSYLIANNYGKQSNSRKANFQSRQVVTFTKQTLASNEETKKEHETSVQCGNVPVNILRSRSLHFKSNHLHGKLKQCHITKQTANCTGLGTHVVPQNLPSNITTLILSKNLLSCHSLLNGPFRKYGALRTLLLDNNKIFALPDQAFQGLSNLIHLDLYNNTLKMNSELNSTKAFVPLKNLQRLILNRNNGHLSSKLFYPDKALSYLSNLQILEIDGLPNKKFGFYFHYLKYLKTLIMAGFRTGYCDLSILRNDTFENMRSIRYLNISDCKIVKTTMGASALEPLQNLETLDVSYNFQLGFDGFGKLVYGQRANQNLKHLILKIIVERYEPCIIVYKDTLTYLKNLRLETIDAYGNGIEMIEYEALKSLPPTLREVNLMSNKIMLGKYWRDLDKMQGLEILYLDGFDRAYKLPTNLPPKYKCSSSSESKKAGYKDAQTQKPHLDLALPPNLQNVTMRNYYMSYKITEMSVLPHNKLYMLNLHGNYFPKLLGPVYGLNNLAYLDMSACNVMEISEIFFSEFTSLKSLNLFQNLIGDSLNDYPDRPIFVSHSLEELFLGFNNIFHLGKKVLERCKNLVRLDLSKNRLNNVEFWTEDLDNLAHLNLSGNAVTTLPKEVMDHFDSMILSGKIVSIDMTFNPISCDCDNIDFLKWVTHNNIFGTNYANYLCYDAVHRTKKEMTEGYAEEVGILNRQCADNRKLLICVISATFAFFIVLFAVVIYRFRWTMRYWYHVVRLMWTNRSDNGGIEYEHDVFVCYGRQDKRFITEELEVKLSEEREMKVLLHDECFQDGQAADNIVMAIRKCRKTLMVVSEATLASNWCVHELEMSRQEAISSGRNVLVFLSLGKISFTTLEPDLTNHIRSNPIFTYPSDPTHLESFWNKLTNELMS